LVEDHQDTARALARLLRRAGHDVTVAHATKTARDLLGQQGFDLLISDIGLPDGTGLDVVGTWKAHKMRGPSIALTGFGMDQDIARCRAAGFTEHLTKPVNFARLDAMIRSMAATPEKV
jgi:DNA-binding response OmpR family regulator